MSEAPVKISPDTLAALRSRIGSAEGVLPLESFIGCVLYDPVAGYYRRRRKRVGRTEETDFYTAPSLGDVFSQLLVKAIHNRLGEHLCLEAFTFVEAGPESPHGVLGGDDSHGFREIRLFRPGDPLPVPSQAVVFSNELFDAQPFRRFVFREGQWREMGVRLKAERLDWVLMGEAPDLPPLPAQAPEGYIVDWPSGAHALLESICAQDWQGLFLAFDYGLERSTVLRERPEGTGRTYAGHRMGTDLLENPGHTDITCHLIWEEMEAILQRHGFKGIRVQRQESFFMHHARPAIEAILRGTLPGLSRSKQTLMELLHPDNMGHKFQVLSATREES